MKPKALLLLCLSISVSSAFAAKEVSIQSLLPEMTDLNRLAERPSPYYKTAQASSYDRASVTPNNDTWFANGDAGQFIRVEKKDGHNEYVMLDAKGPGAIVRFWSANPAGTVRFYFDGSEKASWECPLNDLLGGKTTWFKDPFSYIAAAGWNLYFPIPYAKSLKVTIDEGGRWIYYQIGYRTYESNAKVKTFSIGQVEKAKALIDSVGKQLLSTDWQDRRKSLSSTTHSAVVESGSKLNILDAKAGESGLQIDSIKIKLKGVSAEDMTSAATWSNPAAIQNASRNLILKISFDGEPCVEVPVADFFGSAPGLNPYLSYPTRVEKDGTMTCRFSMPFKKSAVAEIVNVGSVPVKLDTAVTMSPRPFTKSTYHFHAQWLADRLSSRPMKDMSYLNATGEGNLVGVNVHISNTSTAWWGEGDEKVYVDGETFPSTFGTGTEDYFGYAWCSPVYFTRPYHAQPRVDGPANFGQVCNIRYQIFDSIPYSRSMKFDMELWHWAEVNVTYARTAYWYAKPGGTRPAKVNESLLLPPYLSSRSKVQGAIEGEMLSWTKTGGNIEVQRGFFDASESAQLWWASPNVGDKLTVIVPVAEDGEYDVVLGHCKAGDYGKHAIRLIGGSNDSRVTELDMYDPNLHFAPDSLGKYHLKKGFVTLQVTVLGKNPAAKPGMHFSIDYVLLKPVK